MRSRRSKLLSGRTARRERGTATKSGVLLLLVVLLSLVSGLFLFSYNKVTVASYPFMEQPLVLLSPEAAEKKALDDLQPQRKDETPPRVDTPVVVQRKEASPASAVDVLGRPLPAGFQVTKLAPTLETCASTIVTGYFRIPSKFKAEKYRDWMENFLSIQDCLVIFSSADMMETLQELRAHAPGRTVLIELEIDDLPIAQLHASVGQSSPSSTTDSSFWQNQLEIDPERRIHRSYQLFWIWLSKSWCVVKAIGENYFGSEIFMWQDIGSYRNKAYNGQRIIQHLDMIPSGTLLWMAHHPPNAPPDPIWNDKQHEKQFYFHSGSQGAGHKDVWLSYHEKFAETMDLFLAQKMFIGEDQCLLQATCQRFPDMCAYVKFTEVQDNHYFGLRYVLVNGGSYNYWRMPGATSS